MKLRIKVYHNQKALIIDLEKEDKVTVLFEKVAIELEQKFGIKNLPIVLSLNGKEPMVADPESFVKELGLVPGDLLYLLNVPTLSDINEISDTSTPEPSRKLNFSSACDELQPKLRKIDEPVQIHESRLNAYPPNLQRFVDQHSPLLQTPLEFLAAIFHVLMLESGFWPQKYDPDAIGTDLYHLLPERWEWVGGCMKLHYMSSLSPHATCTLTIVELGPYSVTRGTSALTTESFGAKFLVSDYVRLSDFQKVELFKLQQLSRELKNNVAYPLLIALQEASKGSLPPSLKNLPPEITFSLLCRLDFASLLRLGQTCRQFRTWLSDQTLWKHLFSRDFPSTKVHEEGITDWKQLYKKFWLEKKEYERNCRALCIFGSFLPACPPPSVPDLIPRPLPFIPGMVGGDHDRFPILPEPPNRLRLPDPFPVRPPIYRPSFGGGSGFRFS